MKKIISLAIAVFFAFTNLTLIAAEAKTTSVRGYKKKNGHYVQAHVRKVPPKKHTSSKRRK